HDRRPDHTGHRRVPRRAGSQESLLERVQGARPVVGGAASLLSRERAAALLALLGVLVLYAAGAGVLPDWSNRWDTAFLAAVLLPVTLAVVWLLLPVEESPRTIYGGVALAAVAAVLYATGLDSLFNAAKLLALTALGFAFLRLFQPPLGWLVLVAAIIPWVDAYSVWKGPTHVVVNEHPGLFDRVSIGFRFPGEDATANLGPPDVFFFAVFLAAARHFRLRTGWTFTGMTGCLAVTLVLTSVFDLSGLPALPAISAGFLLPDVDLLWHRWRGGRLSEVPGG